MKQLAPLLFALCLLGTPTAILGANRLAVRMRPESFTAAAAGTSTDAKLAPELLLAVESGAAYLGNTADGRPVYLPAPDRSNESAINGFKQLAQVAAVAESPAADLRPVNELIVFSEDEGIQTGTSISELRIVRRHAPGQFVVVRSPAGFSAAQLRALQQNQRLRYIEPNHRFSLAAAGPPDDPAYLTNALWGLANIHAPAAWVKGTDSPITVAVIDTGVDYRHPDLAANMWVNPGETGLDAAGQDKATNGKDDDNDGFVDNVHGADFYNNDGDPRGRFYHGTHVAGTIGAIGNNHLGVVGVNWRVKIMAVQIFSDQGRTDLEPETFADQAARAIDFAVAKGAKVLNNSWGGPFDNAAVRLAVNRAEKAGVLFVACAGNDASNNDQQPYYPASYPNGNVLAVGAIDAGDRLAGFSNFGLRSVALTAPGVGIYSTTPGANYGFSSGTSMATPHVSGAAALVWAQPQYAGARAADIRRLLLDNARRVPALGTNCSTGATLDLLFLGGGLQATNKPGLSGLPESGDPAPVNPAGSLAPPQARSLRGRLRFPIFALGGETTGYELRTGSGVFELEPPKDETMKKLWQELNGKNVVVEGMVSEKKGVEFKKRIIMQVTDLKSQ